VCLPARISCQICRNTLSRSTNKAECINAIVTRWLFSGVATDVQQGTSTYTETKMIGFETLMLRLIIPDRIVKDRPVDRSTDRHTGRIERRVRRSPLET
jgi:hypothetical protein